MRTIERYDTRNRKFTEARLAKGISQGSLATIIGYSSTESIRTIENYGRTPRPHIRKKIAEILDIEENELWPEIKKETK